MNKYVWEKKWKKIVRPCDISQRHWREEHVKTYLLRTQLFSFPFLYLFYSSMIK